MGQATNEQLEAQAVAALGDCMRAVEQAQTELAVRTAELALVCRMLKRRGWSENRLATNLNLTLAQAATMMADA